MLELNKITKQYGRKKALDQVSLTLKEGVYGLLGPNGAGKSTLMSLITGNLTPTSGHIFWDGTEILKMGAAYRSLLGYAPQQQGLYDNFTGLRFSLLYGRSQRHSEKETERRNTPRSVLCKYDRHSQPADRNIFRRHEAENSCRPGHSRRSPADHSG